MQQPSDITGARFGRLVVGHFSHRGGKSGHRSFWFCTCDCGGTKVVAVDSLRSGRAVSCGCRRQETKSEFTSIVTKHGLSGTPEYRSWKGLRARCLSPNNPKYPSYGGRGIKVCERWDSFENFYADMGPRPTPQHSLDRINNDGNYEPGNCRWASKAEQGRNQRSNVVIEIDGEKITQADAAKRFGVSVQTIASRRKRGWDIKRAFTEKAR